MQPGGQVGDADAGRGRRVLLATAEAGETGQRLDEQVLAGPPDVRAVLAVADAGAVHEPRVPLRERLVAQPEPLHDARPEVLDDDVGLVDQAKRDVDAVGRLEVEDDAALVPVVRDERDAHPADVGVLQRVAAHPVARRGLDLDDLSPQVAEDLGGERALRELAEVHDDDACQRTGHRVTPSGSNASENLRTDFAASDCGCGRTPASEEIRRLVRPVGCCVS